jgi:hypothetical protein
MALPTSRSQYSWRIQMILQTSMNLPSQRPRLPRTMSEPPP